MVACSREQIVVEVDAMRATLLDHRQPLHVVDDGLDATAKFFRLAAPRPSLLACQLLAQGLGNDLGDPLMPPPRQFAREFLGLFVLDVEADGRGLPRNSTLLFSI